MMDRIDGLGNGTARVGLLFNPLSGRIRKRREAIRCELAGIPGATCREAGSGAEMRAAVEAFVAADTDLLVIVGGDGTVQAVLNHLFSMGRSVRWPILAVIPGGTTNMTALDLGIQGSPEQNLQKLKKSLAERDISPLIQRHVLCIEQIGSEKVYGMFFGAGLIARAVIFSQGKVKQLGVTGEIYSALIMLGYLAGALMGRRAGAWAPVRMSIYEGEGGQREEREETGGAGEVELNRGTYAFLFASTLDRLLFGMRPYWGAGPEPLHVTFVHQQRKRPLRSLFRLLAGRGEVLKEEDGYHSLNTRSLELLMDDDYIVDGESFRANGQNGPLRITAAGPAAFLVPNGADTEAQRVRGARALHASKMGDDMAAGASVTDQSLPDELVSEMAQLSAEPVSPDFHVLVEALKGRFGSSLDAVLLYGSCLRAHEIGDGVVDFYAVVNDYRDAYPKRHLRYFNTYLPPNVFYLEVPAEEKIFRAKYAVLSMADFELGTRQWFHSYVWARFAQPSRLLYARDDATRRRIHEALAHAVVRFLRSSLPMLDTPEADVETIWTNGLSLTYAAELRPERPGRARQLARFSLDEYERMTAYALPAFVGKLEAVDGGYYRCLVSAADRRRSEWRWRLRRWQGKVLSVLRLTKAAFTFNDSISYAAWKIERHTGVRVEVTPMLQRHPVLWGLKVSWQLLRRGVMR